MRIGVLMGGMSSEREISLKSGQAVYHALTQKGYNAIRIDVGRDVYKKLVEKKIDIAFIALHGKYGEDGAIQGLLEMAGIPYSGSGVLASAIAINKVLAKKIFMLNKIPTPAFAVVDHSAFKAGARHALPLPLIVKPNSQGSTIGVSIVNNKREFAVAVKKAFKYDDTALVEKFIKGRELTVGILNNNPLPIIEVRPQKGIYDFKAKYTKGMTEYIVPARIPEAIGKKVKGIALKAFHVLGCSGAARVDIMLDSENRPYVLEVNTIPGMTELSLLPKAAECAGMTFSEMAEEILLCANGARRHGL
ncbi:MAG: D-alanine--D-alanine ligase [Deltaproteobacteria bacterium]|nr:D-alanine--D-alanine ligase [Deltaproteobacteria bacterium]